MSEFGRRVSASFPETHPAGLQGRRLWRESVERAVEAVSPRTVQSCAEQYPRRYSTQGGPDVQYRTVPLCLFPSRVLERVTLDVGADSSSGRCANRDIEPLASRHGVRGAGRRRGLGESKKPASVALGPVLSRSGSNHHLRGGARTGREGRRGEKKERGERFNRRRRRLLAEPPRLPRFGGRLLLATWKEGGCCIGDAVLGTVRLEALAGQGQLRFPASN